MVNGVRTDDRPWWALAGVGTLGIWLALLAAPVATADPVDSGEPAPQSVAEATPASAAMPAVATAPVAESTTPSDGVPHLPSPDNLPPGTTQAAPEGPKMSYLRYLWQAVQTPGVTMSDALVLIAQRPLDAKSGPVATTPPPAVPESVAAPTEPVAVAPATP